MIAREAATGRVSRLEQGDVCETVSLISAPATVLYDVAYTRDELGRLAMPRETVDSAARGRARGSSWMGKQPGTAPYPSRRLISFTHLFR
ncbi:MAG: hypothetical protein KatS3mg077_1329 [Candidatus Binatia bacterium]|nr:MAG: hypothetical protein KatS3mg077_1329 [Candidatus Binatia bacterium]